MEVFKIGVGKGIWLQSSWKFWIRKKWQRSWEGSKFPYETVTWGIWFETESEACRFLVNTEVTQRLKKSMCSQDILLFYFCGVMGSQLRSLMIGTSPGEGMSLKRGEKASKQVTGCGRRWCLDWEAQWVSLRLRVHSFMQGASSNNFV